MGDANRKTDNRPDPDALLALAGGEGRGKLTLFLGAAPGVGKTFAMLTRARRLQGRRHRHRRRPGRDAWPQRDRGPARRAGGAAAPAGRPSGPADRGIRPRRGAGPPARHHHRRRARAYQCARQPPSQALSRHRGTARRRHQRLVGDEHPASGKPVRRRGARSPACRSASACRTSSCSAPTTCCWSTSRRPN